MKNGGDNMATWSKEVFAKNLRHLMDENGKNQKEIAEIVGVSAPTVNDWLKAKIYPRIDKIEILANHFGILKSDLIEAKPIRVSGKTYSDAEVGSLIKRKRLEKGFTQTQLAEILGTSTTTVARWESGNVNQLQKSPMMKTLANALGVPPLVILGFATEETEPEDKRQVQHEEWERQFADVDFTDEEFDEIINFAKYVLSKRPTQN